MSEASRGGGAFAKVVQKTLVRTKTKVLQRVGKAGKTTDDVFKDNIIAFQKQQATATRLQKETKHYIACVRAMSMAAKSLYAVLKDTYEEDWYDPQSLNSSLNSLELLHTSYEAELAERVYTDLNEYIDEFPVYKEKMNKRNRKLLDYDNARREYDSLYTAKKPDHSKLSKAHEALEDSKYLYEEINNELHKALPRFHEHRVEFVANNLMKLFNAEATFHTNTGKVNDKLTEQLQTLATSHTEEMERLTELPPKNSAETSHNAEDPEALDMSSLSADLRSPSKSNGHRGDMVTAKPNQHAKDSQAIILSHPSMQDNVSSSESKPSTSSASSFSVLYQVMATHPYVAEDEDELSFEAGQIVRVIEFDNEEEQDDGWLMGINTVTQAKGVFPANFTQRIARKT